MNEAYSSFSTGRCRRVLRKAFRDAVLVDQRPRKPVRERGEIWLARAPVPVGERAVELGVLGGTRTPNLLIRSQCSVPEVVVGKAQQQPALGAALNGRVTFPQRPPATRRASPQRRRQAALTRQRRDRTIARRIGQQPQRPVQARLPAPVRPRHHVQPLHRQHQMPQRPVVLHRQRSDHPQQANWPRAASRCQLAAGGQRKCAATPRACAPRLTA